MRILYVEDNPANVSLLKRVAREHELVNYVDGEEALRNFEKDKPDLVLMDIQLTGRLSGLDVVRELRQKGYTVPIIAVTAYAMIGDRERCLAAGCDDYMAKPLPIPDLLRLFEKRKQEIEASITMTTSAPVAEEKAETPVIATETTATSPVSEPKPETMTTSAPVAEEKAETPVIATETTATSPVSEPKPETMTTSAPVAEEKAETPVIATETTATSPVSEPKPEIMTTSAPVAEEKAETPVIATETTATSPVSEPKPEIMTTSAPVAEEKAETPVITDTLKIDNASKVDESDVSNQKDEGDIKITL